MGFIILRSYCYKTLWLPSNLHPLAQQKKSGYKRGHSYMTSGILGLKGAFFDLLTSSDDFQAFTMSDIFETFSNPPYLVPILIPDVTYLEMQITWECRLRYLKPVFCLSLSFYNQFGVQVVLGIVRQGQLDMSPMKEKNKANQLLVCWKKKFARQLFHAWHKFVSLQEHIFQ